MSEDYIKKKKIAIIMDTAVERTQVCIIHTQFYNSILKTGKIWDGTFFFYKHMNNDLLKEKN